MTVNDVIYYAVTGKDYESLSKNEAEKERWITEASWLFDNEK